MTTIPSRSGGVVVTRVDAGPWCVSLVTWTGDQSQIVALVGRSLLRWHVLPMAPAMAARAIQAGPGAVLNALHSDRATTVPHVDAVVQLLTRWVGWRSSADLEDTRRALLVLLARPPQPAPSPPPQAAAAAEESPMSTRFRVFIGAAETAVDADTPAEAAEDLVRDRLEAGAWYGPEVAVLVQAPDGVVTRWRVEVLTEVHAAADGPDVGDDKEADLDPDTPAPVPTAAGWGVGGA